MQNRERLASSLSELIGLHNYGWMCLPAFHSPISAAVHAVLLEKDVLRQRRDTEAVDGSGEEDISRQNAQGSLREQQHKNDICV